MKRFLNINLILLAICVLVFLLNGCSNQIERDDIGKGYIGDYYVEIVDYAIDVDADNIPVLAIKYTFTNDSDETACFDWVVDDDVFQNGIALEKVYSDDNIDTDVQSGASIDVVLGYRLNDYSNVDVELTDTLGEFDDKITKTLNISYQ